MLLDKIKKARREQAEKVYHDSLKAIDAETEQAYAEYEKRLVILEEMQRKMNQAFEFQKQELISELGLNAVAIDKLSGQVRDV